MEIGKTKVMGVENHSKIAAIWRESAVSISESILIKVIIGVFEAANLYKISIIEPKSVSVDKYSPSIFIFFFFRLIFDSYTFIA